MHYSLHSESKNVLGIQIHTLRVNICKFVLHLL